MLVSFRGRFEDMVGTCFIRRVEKGRSIRTGLNVAVVILENRSVVGLTLAHPEV